VLPECFSNTDCFSKKDFSAECQNSGKKSASCVYHITDKVR